MKQMNKILILLFFWALGALSFGQMEQYNYKREVKGIEGPWNKIILADAIYRKANQQLSDIRVFGITKDKDTIEAPYILKERTDKIDNDEVLFQLLNTVHNNKGYYFTFKLSDTISINHIHLEFEQQNFDWQIQLEGSQDQKDWYTLLSNYRVLSIKNNSTNYQFTKLTFPKCKYNYFRLFIKSKEQPLLKHAKISKYTLTNGRIRNYTIKKINTLENEELKRTEIDIELNTPVRVSQIHLGASNKIDYYRPITIKYLKDSMNTERGWIYNYSILKTGTLNSLEENTFKFASTTLQKIKILIANQNNQPLSIDTIQVGGYINELLVRFTQPAAYFLTYGNKNARSPQYDINRFTKKIPKNLKVLKLGSELTIIKEKRTKEAPLFQNKLWLWSLMLFIILILGWFSLKMIKKGS